MNVDRTDFTVIMTSGKERYKIHVQVDNTSSSQWQWWACGSDYIDPMESPTGWGLTPEEAISDFFIDIIRQKTQYTKELLKEWRNPNL